MCNPVRYALSGLGRRSTTTYLPVFAPSERERRVELVAVVDADPRRLAEFAERWPTPVRTYLASEFDRMLLDQAPDWAILAAPDHTHHAQILAALDHDVSVISEKPMVIDGSQARQVLDAARASNGRLRVAHNLRCLNLNQCIKVLLSEKRLGQITSVELAYHLTPGHGGSYFRRWHRHRAASGGLSVTKSCHHFDLINWWLDDTPVEVSGWTARRHFFAGTLLPGEPATTVPSDADIEDTIDARIRYGGGAVVSYTLTACSTWEGFELTIRGTEGALAATYDKLSTEDYPVTLRMGNGPEQRLRIPREVGRHSGADHRMLAALFGPPDAEHEASAPLPGALEGALAVAIGDAVHRSAARGAPVMLDEILALDEPVTPSGPRLSEITNPRHEDTFWLPEETGTRA
ncbi:putative oxidoreductase protein [Minicystis rosea]|nr:putative oxidoreductase protein [Minicystis rosea]